MKKVFKNVFPMLLFLLLILSLNNFSQERLAKSYKLGNSNLVKSVYENTSQSQLNKNNLKKNPSDYQLEKRNSRTFKTFSVDKSFSYGFLLFEEINQVWDGNNWINDVKTYNAYNERNLRISFVYQVWNGSQWTNNEKTSFTYDAIDSLKTKLTQSWDGNSWLNNKIESRTYNSDGYLSELIVEYWDSVWVTGQKQEYKHDQDGNFIELLKQYWDGFEWVNDELHLHKYDLNNNMVEKFVQTCIYFFPSYRYF